MLRIYKFLSDINKGGINQGERGVCVWLKLLMPKAVNLDRFFYRSPNTASHMWIKKQLLGQNLGSKEEKLLFIHLCND